MLVRRFNTNPLTSLFDDFFATPRFTMPLETTAAPALDFAEKDDAFLVMLDVPGVKENDLDVTVQDNQLVVRGRRTLAGDNSEGITWHRRERSIQEFQRVIALPSEVDSSHIEATLSEGVLTIMLPKAETAKPRRVAVKVK